MKIVKHFVNINGLIIEIDIEKFNQSMISHNLKIEFKDNYGRYVEIFYKIIPKED